jgi:hypothetical protein
MAESYIVAGASSVPMSCALCCRKIIGTSPVPLDRGTQFLRYTPIKFMPLERTYRAGASIEDYCRACKTDRNHTIIVVDAEARPVRVTCDYCRSEHNYRGGGRVAVSGEQPAPAAASTPRGRQATAGPFPIVSDRERITPAMTASSDDLELLLRRIIREEAGITPVVPADKWRGGSLVLRPGSEGLQEKSWPIETFFHKIVMLRNRLRTLEQQVNASDLPDDVKVKLQSYVSGCYGSLTSFNVLFAEEDDRFKGSGGDEK